MIEEKKASEKTNKDMSGKTILKIRKKYKRSFLKTALLLCLYQIKYHILSSLADFIFGRKQRATKPLRFANRAVSKNIRKCHMMAEKCEYYKDKIENLKVG